MANIKNVDIDGLMTDYQQKFGAITHDNYALRLAYPICSKVGKIRVDKNFLRELILEKEDKLIEFAVVEGDICEHNFMAKLDANLKSR